MHAAVIETELAGNRESSLDKTGGAAKSRRTAKLGRHIQMVQAAGSNGSMKADASQMFAVSSAQPEYGGFPTSRDWRGEFDPVPPDFLDTWAASIIEKDGKVEAN